jgi:hypothetical protein
MIMCFGSIHFVLAYPLYDEAVSRSDCIASNDRVTNDLWIGKHIEEEDGIGQI